MPSLALGQLNQQHHGQMNLGLNLGALDSGERSLRLSEHSDSSNSLSQGISARSEAPAHLNLEEINMSEEDLINSYDPKNEENNYHLPHHLFKQLQLDQFRVQCSEVIPGALFISGHQVAGNFDLLKHHKITHIVNTAADVCENKFPDDFQYLTYYLKDTNGEDISLHFYRTLSWISDALSQNGRVMVHCREGVSRSSTMIIAYLMWVNHIQFEQAHQMVRDVRPICNPNTGFTCCLLQLAKKLGVHGPQVAATMHERLEVFRVGPYHPREPFIMLLPVTDWKSSPKLDPRFGYYFQKSNQAWGWIGSQCGDVTKTKQAQQQQVGWLQRFENFGCSFQLVHEGHEPSQMSEMLEIDSSILNAGLVTVNPALDDDAELMRAGRQAAA
jgi:protein-tyrosine phosphatase